MADGRSIASRRDELLPYLRRLLITIGVLAVVALAIILRDVWILAFAAVLAAIAFGAISGRIGKITRLNSKWSLALAVLLVFFVIGGAFFLAWPQIQTQMPNLIDRIGESLDEIQATFGIQIPDSMAEITETLGGMTDQLWSGIMGIVSGFATVVTSILLVIVAGIFIAAEPSRYRAGVTLLFPKSWHDTVGSGMGKIGDGLRMWLRAQLVAMVVVGLLTGVGAWAIGLPSPLALGLIAGLGEFIPIIGPFIAIVPAVLIAFAEDTQLLIWTVVVYVAVQQFEANLLTPLLQRKIVELPPVLFLFSLVALGLLFGIPGIIVAAPMSVAIYIGIREFYVRNLLKEDKLLDAPVEPPAAKPKLEDSLPTASTSSAAKRAAADDVPPKPARRRKPPVAPA